MPDDIWLQRTPIQFVVHRDRQALAHSICRHAPQLHMPASLGDLLKSESGKNADEIGAG
jgi:hypothetical protein